jgi:hypothetical protein
MLDFSPSNCGKFRHPIAENSNEIENKRICSICFMHG